MIRLGSTESLPQGWRWVDANSVMDVRDGTHDSPKSVDAGIPLVTSKNLVGGKIDFSTCNLITEDDHIAISKRSAVDDGDILYAMIGTIGNPVIVEKQFEFSIKNVALFKFGKSNQVYNRYIYHFLNSDLAIRQFESNSRGGTQKFVSLGNIRGLQIPLPPLAEQERIAAILDKADAIRRKRQQAIQLADDFLRAVFLEIFGDPVTNPKGWEVKKFGDVIDVLTDYHANGSYKTLVSNVTLLNEPNYAYMVRTTDLEKENFTESVKYIDQHAYEHLAKSKVFGGEIIINKIGSAGAVYLMPVLNRPVSLAMNQFLIRCNKLALNEFMFYQLKTESGSRELSKRVQGAVTKTITKDAVREVQIILPPLEQQSKFIEIANKIKDMRKRINESFGLNESNFNSLSQKAFSGQL